MTNARSCVIINTENETQKGNKTMYEYTLRNVYTNEITSIYGNTSNFRKVMAKKGLNSAEWVVETWECIN